MINILNALFTAKLGILKSFLLRDSSRKEKCVTTWNTRNSISPLIQGILVLTLRSRVTHNQRTHTFGVHLKAASGKTVKLSLERYFFIISFFSFRFFFEAKFIFALPFREVMYVCLLKYVYETNI